MTEYHETRRALLDGVMHIGRAVTPDQAERGMSATQLKRRRAPTFMTNERWQYRSLAENSLIVEISFGYFMQKPLFGLTVFCVGDLKGDAMEWDHSLSGALHDVPSVLGRLAELNAGGRERIAALAAVA